MAKLKPRTLSGFMELLPAPQQQMERIMETLRRTYSLYGFTPLDTPIIEASEVLLAKGGGETEKQIYSVSNYNMKSDKDASLALRFDLTVPLAKYVAMNYGQLSFPFRRYQIGKVYRGERAQRGRFREFYQADIDIIGDGQLDIVNEAEIPAIIYQTFIALGLNRFQIRVNNRKILNGFYAMLGLTEQSGDIMRTVDKLDKIGPQAVREILTDDLGLSPERADEILSFIAIKGDNDQVVAALEGYAGRDPLFDQGLEELKTVVRYLSAFGVPQSHFAVDLTIARGLDYYTGTVYETTMLDHPEVGSICSGGRYDNLAEYYTDKKLPGVGISIGLTRLFYVLNEQKLLNPNVPTAPADVLVIPMSPAQQGYAISVATGLRAKGIRTQIYTEQKKFKAKIAYAAKLGIPFALFLGEDEESNGVVSLKDLNKGEQVTVSTEEAAGIVERYLDGCRGICSVSE
ncbi:MAG: histidine--tRNA ligase [Clostridiales bacterium]|nr:histidine--tRNA ligase [Clostridiales bacterium]